MNAITPREFDARLAQLTGQNFVEYDFDAIDGTRGAGWTAFFEVEGDQGDGEWLRLHYPVRSVRLMGAWREDADGNLFCGNRDEIAGIVGEKEVARWEAYVFDREDGQ